MRPRPILWFAISVLCLIGAVCCWQWGERRAGRGGLVPSATPAVGANVRTNPVASHAMSRAAVAASQAQLAAARTNFLARRLVNTPNTAGQLVRNDRALILENALIDTTKTVDFAIPEHLRAAGDPGSYLVQARGPVDDAFRRALTAAGATIVSYIPNNAFLVRMSADAAAQLAGSAQAVLPYEPAYKLKAALLPLGLDNALLPPATMLNVLAFPDTRAQLVALLREQNVTVLGEAKSPFGAVFTIAPTADWLALARSAAVAEVELAHPRVAANDLMRARLGVAADSQATNNYLGLTGEGVLLSLNDTGADAKHPDLAGRLFSDNLLSLTDTNGHGTHVAGIIAGSGLVSTNVQYARGSLNPGTNLQYRGMAPAAKLFVQSLTLGLGTLSDYSLQSSAALTNALISNNSWYYAGDNSYSLAAASYDAAVRDALPGTTGSQPVLFVFPAGNDGAGNDSGLGGDPQSITAPGTAKNVITVGALEQPRDITNVVTRITTTVTNKATPWKELTSSANQVARFSARGNVGISIEGDSGRFKPDVVAPGTFVVSARSTTWDEKAYYNPTSHNTITYEAQIVGSNSFAYYDVFLPENAVGFTINVLNVTNVVTGLRYPAGLPIYVSKVDYPTANPALFDFIKTNTVSVPPDGGGVGSAVGQSWYYGVRNTFTQDLRFDLVADIITTNDLGDYLEVLSNLNNTISAGSGTTTNSATNAVAGTNYYRYESGTSQAAAAVSGTLALMQEFFQRKNITNSPALQKALLINGARLSGEIYDFHVQSLINYQGWGVPQLPNSLHADLTNSSALTASVYYYDQAPTNALATGQSLTRYFSISDAGRTLPLRVTLVWTDPPGNPVAGIKLVNDLDLIVTNLDNGDVFYGNDIPVNSTVSFAWNQQEPPNIDAVNNVENVLLGTGLGTNYSVTVRARRVNVNAVPAHPNNVVQDYALVISSGNGEVPDALSAPSGRPPVFQNTATGTPEVTVITNLFSSATYSTANLEGQRVGANAALLGTTNGITNQWHFFVVTNITDFSNASFFVSDATDLSVPRIGVFQAFTANATRASADVDLYVSTNADGSLLQLVPATIAAADKSLTRNVDNGDEAVIYADSAKGKVYYIGVKSEDQQAAEFELFVVFSLLPLGQEGEGGFYQAIPIYPADGTTADGSSEKYAVTRWRAFVPGGGEIRRVVITNSIYHQAIEELVDAVVSPQKKTVVLNNHTNFTSILPPGPYNYLYEDNDEGDFPLAIHPDGPGKLRDYVGDKRSGQWKFYFVDNVYNQSTGRIADCKIRIDRQPNNGESVTNTVLPNSWQYYAVNVPVSATNLQICLALINSGTPAAAPLRVYVRKDFFPTTNAFDFRTTISPPTGPPPGNCFNITPADLPPLSPGRYYVGVFNPNTSAQTYVYTATYTVDPRGPTPINWNGTGNQPLLDDAVNNFTQFVTNRGRIAQLEVGLTIQHPRVSDLAVTLISPLGTRVLLAENRGGNDTNGFGSSLVISNFIPVAAAGGPAATNILIDTSTTSGSITIDYNFYQVPDQMTVYYEGNLLANTGLISGSGRLVLNYGPGLSTIVEVRMNEFGNPSPSTAWDFTASSINRLSSYLVFTEDANKASEAIKFARPPFTGTGGFTTNISDFESPTVPGDYVSPSLVDGWTLLDTNRVTVVTNPAANTGLNSLALRSGAIQRSLPTFPGESYTLRYAQRKVPNLDGIVSWWPGQSSNAAIDIVDGNIGTPVGAVGLGGGLVGSAFDFNGSSYFTIPDAPNLDFTNALTVEAWVKPRSVTGAAHEIFSKVNGTANQRSYTFSIDAAGHLYFAVSPSGLPVGTTVTGSSILPVNQWTHVAATYDGSTIKVYVNGSLDSAGPWAAGIFAGTSPAVIGATLLTTTTAASFFNGFIDELAVFRRPLAASEIQDIYRAGAAGKCGMVTPPINVCSTAGAQIFIPGVQTNFFAGTTNWQTRGLVFTATGSNTTVGLSPISTNNQSGVLVDSFTLAKPPGPRYVFPEESLKAFEGESARGLWQLEVWDTRTGQTNQVSLLDWQLQFVFQTNTAGARVITPGTPIDTTIPPGQILYFVVDAPAPARFATNVLFNASIPLGFYFNQLVPPTYGATNAGDVLFAAAAQNHTEVLSTTNTAPPTSTKTDFIAGQRYYLAIENAGAVNATFTLYVDFDLVGVPPTVTLTNGVSYCATNPAPLVLDYYLYTVSSNAVRAQFEINNSSGDMTLLLRRGLPPTFAVNDYFSANPFTNDEVVTVFNFSQPVPLTPGDWYLAAANISAGPVSYCVRATEWPVYGTNLVITNVFLGTNSLCLTWTSLAGVHYTIEGKTSLTSTNWITAAPTVTASGPTTTYCVALPSPFQFFRVREGIALNPYYPPPIITSITRRFNGIQIIWGGPPNLQYRVEWSPTLVPAGWNQFSGTVTSTTGLYQFLDDGSQTAGFAANRYYRIVLLP